MPSIADFLGLKIQKEQAMELDGVPFIGPVSASNFKANMEGSALDLSWNTLSKGEKGKVWLSKTNNFKTGGVDQYQELGIVELDQATANFEIEVPSDGFLKVVLETPSGYLNYWIVPSN